MEHCLVSIIPQRFTWIRNERQDSMLQSDAESVCYSKVISSIVGSVWRCMEQRQFNTIPLRIIFRTLQLWLGVTALICGAFYGVFSRVITANAYTVLQAYSSARSHLSMYYVLGDFLAILAQIRFVGILNLFYQ